MESRKQATARLFFALWPDAGVRRKVASHRPNEGRLVAPENWHITLQFLGAVTATQQRMLEAGASTIDVAPFQLQLDYLDYWHGPRLAWLGVSVPPPALLSLHEQLKDLAATVGLAVDSRDYVPHLSLSRGLPAVARRPIDAICWRAAEFCLAESVSGPNGVQYVVRRRWPLRKH